MLLTTLIEESTIAAVCAYALFLQHRAFNGAVERLKASLDSLSENFLKLVEDRSKKDE